MDFRLVDRLVAGFVFLFALVLYLLTMAPTASFWDTGEFIAAAHFLQVSHPPGAPFYMIVGRLFSMFAPDGSVAYALNLVSVLSSALTVLFTHLVIVRLVRAWQGQAAEWTVTDRITALAGGVIGGLTFGATDSFWFNAVEAEVYAMSMLFTAAVVWLIMRWSDQAQQEEALSSGGHQHRLAGLAANRYLILISYLFGLAIGVHLLNLLAIFFIALIVFFQEFDRPEWTTGKRWLGIILAGVVSSLAFLAIYPGIIQVLPTVAGAFGSPGLFFGLVFLLVGFAVYYTQRQGMAVANLVALCFAAVLIGYSTYGLIFIRSAVDPPIDLNDPETAEGIVSYLKREQYGETPMFPRRWSPDPSHQQFYARYGSDGEFFWDYQIGEMYVRYFLWNFMGKASDVQGAPAITGFLPGEGDQYLHRTPSEQASRNAYYALPLLLGLIGAAFHFMQDWRRALAVLALFLITGIGIILYLNQTPYQPRERDYSYVASFFAFSLWVGIGAAGVISLVLEGFQKRWSPTLQRGVAIGLAVVLFAAVPLLVTAENYADHDRSGNYVATDYAHNMLQSVDENAILFTNGDNDTYPLWYLQEVEKVRRDVRVANLSLMNTDWYVKQLKNQPSRESAPLPMSLTDAQISDISVSPWEPRSIQLPVDKEDIFENASEVVIPGMGLDRIESPMEWTLEGRPYNQQFNILYAADQVALDILVTNARQGWQRPVYFAVTVSPDGMLDLENYLQLDGQAYRVAPIKHNEPLGRVVPRVALDRLSKFKFTNLDNPDVYYDENIRRLVDNYRNIFAHTAQQLAQQGHRQEAVALLDSLNENVPFSIIPGDNGSYLFTARAYQSAGAPQKAVEVWKQAEELVIHQLKNPASAQQANMAAQFVQMIRYAYMEAGDFQAAADFGDRLATELNDESLRMSPEELRRQFQEAQQAQAAAQAAAPAPAPDSTVAP